MQDTWKSQRFYRIQTPQRTQSI